MAKREFGPWTWIAGGVALLAGGALIWNRTREASRTPGAPEPPPGTPAENPTCNEGYTYDEATRRCVRAGGTPEMPSFLPEIAAMKGAMLPPHGKILLLGGELAVGLAQALAKELAAIEQMNGYPVTPSAMSVWDGAPVLYSFELLSASLGVNGVPKAPACEACPPDLVIIFSGERNMHWGPVDEGTRKAIAHIADTFAIEARDHYPNMLWVAPPSNPEFDEPANQSLLKGMVFSAAQLARPGRSAFLNPKKFEAPYPAVGGILGPDPMMVDHARPNEAGYAAIAKQVAEIITKWYGSHPGQASA